MLLMIRSTNMKEGHPEVKADETVTAVKARIIQLLPTNLRTKKKTTRILLDDATTRAQIVTVTRENHNGKLLKHRIIVTVAKIRPPIGDQVGKKSR